MPVDRSLETEMKSSLVALGFSLMFFKLTKTTQNEDYFDYEGLVDNLPPDKCSGLIWTTSLPGPVSPITCGSECLKTPGCSRFFSEDSGDGKFNCTAAEKFVDWQPTKGSGKTAFSKVCQDSIQVTKPTDCLDLRVAGNDCSGYYTIYPDTITPVDVYCDMQTDLGGWTAIQRRFSSDVDFQTTWTAYRDGFGTKAEYWLGNHWIHHLTDGVNVELYIRLEDWSCERRFARYDTFSIGSEADKFRLYLSGFTGNAGESMLYNSGKQFTTMDQDNDPSSTNCAVQHHRGGWWYGGCSNSVLNGLRHPSRINDPKSMYWISFRGQESLRSSLMMIRRK